MSDKNINNNNNTSSEEEESKLLPEQKEHVSDGRETLKTGLAFKRAENTTVENPHLYGKKRPAYKNRSHKATGRPRGRPPGTKLQKQRTSKKSGFYRKHWADTYSLPLDISRREEVKEAGVDYHDLSSLYNPNSPYTVEDKFYAVTAYIMTGSSYKAEKLTGIPQETILRWKKHSSWWQDAAAEVHRAKQEELDGRMTEIIHLATEDILDRIVHGNPVLDSKTGEEVRVPLTMRDLNFIVSNIFEKRALIRGDPTSRTEKINTDATLTKLATRMEQAYAKLRQEQERVVKVIDVEPEKLEVFDAEEVTQKIEKDGN